MSLSVTGSLLTGPFLRPDITWDDLELSVHRGDPQLYISESTRLIDHSVKKVRELKSTFVGDRPYYFLVGSGPRIHWSNKCGLIPGISTITGIGRTFVGLVHMIAHLAKAIFDQPKRDKHLNEARLGLYNVMRGLVEAIPVAGNLVVAVFDLYRLNKEIYHKDVTSQLQKVLTEKDFKGLLQN